jgi:hypothetical protein
MKRRSRDSKFGCHFELVENSDGTPVRRFAVGIALRSLDKLGMTVEHR